MAYTLHAQVPFPEQADVGQPLDVVFPRRENDRLYDALQKLADATAQKLKADGGITIVIDEIPNYPGMHEKLNAQLRTLDRIQVTRRGAELVLSNPTVTSYEAKKQAQQTMSDVVAEMRGPASPTGETAVMNTGATVPMARPGKQAVRGLSDEDKAKLRGARPQDSKSAAEEMLARLKSKR